MRSDDPTTAVHTGVQASRAMASIIDSAAWSRRVELAPLKSQRSDGIAHAEVAPDKRSEFRVGIHLAMLSIRATAIDGRGSTISPRVLEVLAKAGRDLSSPSNPNWQVKGADRSRLTDLGVTQLKNSRRVDPGLSLESVTLPRPRPAPAPTPENPAPPRLRSSSPAVRQYVRRPKQEYFSSMA